MQFIEYASGSRGNLYEIIGTKRRLVLECGLPWAAMLEKLHFRIDDIEGLCLSHQHADHSKAAKKVMQNGIDIYASAETFRAIGGPDPLSLWRRAKVVEPMRIVTTGEFGILPFEVCHDCQGALGFVVRETATDEYLLFATDTCMLTQAFPYRFSIIALACNYDMEILQSRLDAGTISEARASRLLTAHPEKDWVKDFLRRFCNLPAKGDPDFMADHKCRKIHLLHRSDENLGDVVREIEEEFGIPTF